MFLLPSKNSMPGLGRPTEKRREGSCTSTVNCRYHRNTGKKELCENKNSYLIEITTDTEMKLVGDYFARYNINLVAWTRRQTGKRRERLCTYTIKNMHRRNTGKKELCEHFN